MNSTTTTNASPSVTSDRIPPDASLEFKIVKIVFYVAIFVLTIVGNVLVITVIRYDKRMRSSSHILILNLAVCDLITPTISIPFDLAYEEMSYAWPFGGVMCKILWPGQTFTTTSSALILTAICIDRYRALVHPFKVRWAGKFCLMVFGMYIFAVSMVVPYFLVLHFDEGKTKVDCLEKWPSPQKSFRQAYTIVLFVSQYALPLVIMITLYSITLRSLFKNSKQFLSESSIVKPGSQIQNKSRDDCRRELSIQELRKEQHLKVTKMFITVVIVFAVSMFPNQILWLWVDFGNLADNEYFPIISIICRIFTYSNSVLNPLIYGLYSKDFRSGYKKAGRSISNVNKRHQPLYHHFNGTGKSQFQSSYTSRGAMADDEKNLINRNKRTCKGSNQEHPLKEKKQSAREEDPKEAKEGKRCLREQNCLNKKAVLSRDVKPMKDKSSTTVQTVFDTEDSRKIPEHQNTLSTLENEVEEGVEEESVESASLFPMDNQKENKCDVMNIDTCIDSQGSQEKDLVDYLDELTETQC